ncbi:MAG: 50S ribosomal protein L25 [Saprospiraceae bacterium]|nr:50S ribosomal protein L25 [Saprospiraceae bacterium]
MQTVEINGQNRVIASKAGLRDLRNEGMIPCVLYSKDENLTFSAPAAELRQLVYTPDFKIAEIKLNGNSYKCIVKDLQFNPITDKVTHIDFLKLVNKTSIKVSVPLRTKGSAVGVKSGGKLTQKIRSILIKTTPEHLVSELFVDISSMDLGQTMRVKDITPENGVEILIPSSTPVASVEIPRALKTGEAEAGKDAASTPAK